MTQPEITSKTGVPSKNIRMAMPEINKVKSNQISPKVI